MAPDLLKSLFLSTLHDVFYSLFFLYLWLPFSVLISRLASRGSRQWNIYAMVALSAVFIIWNDASALPILSFSLLGNYMAGFGMSLPHANESPKIQRTLFIGGIVLNLLVLCFYKYGLTPEAAGTGSGAYDILIPLGLSFYTFTQIAFLREIYEEKIHMPNVTDYLACILFFPKFIAGPVMRPSEFLPQLARIPPSIDWRMAVGFISLGLFKKVILADTLAPFADGAFYAAQTGAPLAVHTAWHGLLAYGLQLYFDFSGYTDMAIGIGLLFGIALPLNFRSPYRSVNISDFWRRWHMSLSFFLRDYVYIPLGGNRKGGVRTMLNLLILMILVGAWHGSSITFIAWGIMHGLFLIIHRLWSMARKNFPASPFPSWIGRTTAQLFTFFCVTVAWVPFRAGSAETALSMFSALFRIPDPLFDMHVFFFMLLTIGPALLIVWTLPDSARWLSYDPARAPSADEKDPRISMFWRGILHGCCAVTAILFLAGTQVFIYQGF